MTKATDPISVPTMPNLNDQLLATGRTVFASAGCHQCHSRGDPSESVPVLHDVNGEPTLAPDIARAPLKGGGDFASLYRRIRLGMPGTPHPAAASLSVEEAVALVAFCQSLRTGEPATSTNHQRAERILRHTNPETQSNPADTHEP